ncbi:MAG: sugar transferase [Bacteroidetes bacterium]|nr:MAG: sugar transferase [Bacteroidota bacterium]
MLKRLFDILISFVSLIFLIPVFVLFALLIALNSKGGVFYSQSRVGRNNNDFKLLKFRTMFSGSEKKGLLTVGESDSRITSTGKWLRKFKLDELPQLLNILKGEMSFVGPRPEVRKYVDMYNERQKLVLSVKPGLTDYASIEYANENETLAKYPNAEKAYIEIIMPAKLKLNMKYIEEKNLWVDLKIIFRTIGKVLVSH